MRFYVAEKLSGKQSPTPEGFLLCESVPICRTGEMLYGPGEVPVESGPDGIVRIERSPEEVFNTAHILSYNGKPVVNEHPQGGEVTPENWRQLAVGVVMNSRRGEGALSDFILADLLITDASAIYAVQQGKRQVSCGYDAEYDQLEPGKGKQYSLIGNHVALVEQARCGPSCAIGDEDTMAKRTLKEKIVAWATGDRNLKSLDEMLEEGEEAPSGDEGGNAQHIHLHMAGSEGKDTGDEETGEVTKKETQPDPLKEVKDALGAIGKRLDSYDEKFAAFTKKDENKGEDAGEIEEEDPEAKATGNAVGDSMGLVGIFQETLSRAEILAPGTRLITIDAKAKPKATADALCGFRRRVLTEAFSRDGVRQLLEPLLGGRKIEKMSCDSVKMTFVSASEMMRQRNNHSATTTKVATGTGDIKKGPQTLAELNKANRERYGQTTR